MTRSATTLTLLAVLCAGLLSGCGALRPGLAAQVGDQTLTDEDVDRVSRETCLVVKENPQFPPSGIPRSQILEFVVAAFVLRATAEQLAEDHGVSSSPEYAEVEATLREQLDTLRPGVDEDVVETFTSVRYFEDIRDVLGERQLRAEGAQQVTLEEATAKGTELAQVWQTDHEIAIDPRFPEFSLTDQSELVPDRERGTVAVSDFAQQAAADQPDPSYVQSLPARQRCG